jgi:general secretion pathway protein D
MTPVDRFFGMHWLRTLAAALGLAVALTSAAAPEPAAAATGGAETYTFAFRDAEVAQVAQEVLGAVGLPFAIDPGVTGRISFRIEQRLTREQLLAAFGAVLETNGFALVRNGDQLIVTLQSKAKGSAGVRRRSEGAPSAGYEVLAIPLSYAQPSEVAKALEAISSQSNVVYTNDRLGLLLLGGTGGQLKTAMETIKIFDQSGFEDTKIRWFELSQAQSQTVASELERIIQGAGLVGVSVVPLRRLNGIIVFARSGEALGDIARWVSRLDTPGKEASSSLWVYRPRATSAETLARTLNSVLGFQNSVETSTSTSDSGTRGPAPAAPPAVTTTTSSTMQSLTGDEQARIVSDKETNTLIVFASPGRWAQIQRILLEIDRTPRQILIEASILEVTLTKGFEFGVDWSVLSGDLQASSINNDSGTIGPSTPGLSITFLQTDIKAAVHALGSRTALEVVSAPKIIALDNHTAHLQVGDQVPIVTQSSRSTNDSNAPLVNSVDYRSTGVILTVTPRVTGEDQLTLEVSQEVSSVAKTSSSGIDSPTIKQRRFESALVMHDGGVVALGGLIASTRGSGDSGVPWLKDVPVLGSLFKSASRNGDRTELIVLLTAKIIRDRPTSDAVMNDLFNDLHELQTRGLVPTAKKP